MIKILELCQDLRSIPILSPIQTDIWWFTFPFLQLCELSLIYVCTHWWEKYWSTSINLLINSILFSSAINYNNCFCLSVCLSFFSYSSTCFHVILFSQRWSWLLPKLSLHLTSKYSLTPKLLPISLICNLTITEHQYFHLRFIAEGWTISCQFLSILVEHTNYLTQWSTPYSRKRILYLIIYYPKAFTLFEVFLRSH